MKRVIGTVIFMTALCAASVAHAAVGDVVGSVYTTDIRAFINGVEVPSYSIGGKTAVAVEEVLREGSYAYIYNDELRTLLVNDLSPQNLVGGRAKYYYGSIGMAVGKIYETDIKTYFYDTLVPAYAIGGKTAVAIEDIGEDRVYSDIGGKYVWDPQERTISLDFMYNSNYEISTILHEKNLDIRIDDGKVSLERNLFAGGTVSMSWTAVSPAWIIPIEYEAKAGMSEIIGFNFKRPIYCFQSNENGKMSLRVDSVNFNYIRAELLEGAINETDIKPFTRDEIIDFYIERSWCDVKKRADTDAYTFAYMTGPTPHGGTGHLLLVRSDGTYHDYANDFKSVSLHGTKWFDNVSVTSEKAEFRYDTDYEIDLKTGIMTKHGEAAASQYPAIPETGRAHYLIYREGYRDNRIELAEFDTAAKALSLNRGRLEIPQPESYTHDIKYYLDGDKWMEFERDYERVSENAAEVLESDMDVIRNGTYIELFRMK